MNSKPSLVVKLFLTHMVMTGRAACWTGKCCDAMSDITLAVTRWVKPCDALTTKPVDTHVSQLCAICNGSVAGKHVFKDSLMSPTNYIEDVLFFRRTRERATPSLHFISVLTCACGALVNSVPQSALCFVLCCVVLKVAKL